MNNVSLMGILERSRHLPDVGDDHVKRKAHTRRIKGPQTTTRRIVHDQKRDVFLHFAVLYDNQSLGNRKFKHAYNVRMDKAGQQLRFYEEMLLLLLT